MNINFQLRLYTDDESWLCFHHAVIAAARGKNVMTEVDDYDDGYHMGPTNCTVCRRLDRERLGMKP